MMRRRRIRRRYLRTWFVIDLIATFPYSWFLDYSLYAESNKAVGGAVSATT